MAIQRQVGRLAQRTNQDWANRDVRNEMSVHHIHMDDGTAALGRSLNLLRQMGKVSRQNRRCKLDQTWAPFMRIRTKILTRGQPTNCTVRAQQLSRNASLRPLASRQAYQLESSWFPPPLVEDRLLTESYAHAISKGRFSRRRTRYSLPARHQ